MRILGLDPGTGRLGYGVAEGSGGSYRCLAVGCFTAPAGTPASERLPLLQKQLRTLLAAHTVSGAAVERLYFSRNARTALAVAEARGMILTTLGEADIPVLELSPQAVKLGVTGYGRATKRQIQRMVQQLFTLPRPPAPDDAADALALAFAGLSHFRNQ